VKFLIRMSNIKDILKKIIQNPEQTLDSLTKEDIAKLSGAINPYQIPTSTESYINISINNITEEYNKKLLTTALIAYVYRMLFEYEASDETKAEIKTFLNHQFEYDPDRHLRSAHKENLADPERMRLDDARAEMSTGTGKLKPSCREHKKEHACCGSVEKATTFQATIELMKICNKMIASASSDDNAGLLLKTYKKLGQVKDSLKACGPRSLRESEAALNHIPSANMFESFKRYLGANYDALRFATHSIYSEKPDLEFAITYYDWFNTAEEAREHQIKHQGEFKSEVFTIGNKGVTLLGPFKENAERVGFYNKNLEVLKSMMQQNEDDMKIGEELTKKRIKTVKTKNILTDGPDDAGLIGYNSFDSGISSRSAQLFSKEDEEAALKARAVQEKLEAEALEVVVFSGEIDEEGKTVLGRSTFNTKGETAEEAKKRLL
jgi:hypothetical protein